MLLELYKLIEELALMEKDNEFYNKELLLILVQIARHLVKLNKEGRDITHIELSDYLPIYTNPNLKEDDLNVIYIEKPKLKVNQMN